VDDRYILSYIRMLIIHLRYGYHIVPIRSTTHSTVKWFQHSNSGHSRVKRSCAFVSSTEQSSVYYLFPFISYIANRRVCTQQLFNASHACSEWFVSLTTYNFGATSVHSIFQMLHSVSWHKNGGASNRHITVYFLRDDARSLDNSKFIASSTPHLPFSRIIFTK
jgi:hypothetical protein